MILYKTNKYQEILSLSDLDILDFKEWCFFIYVLFFLKKFIVEPFGFCLSIIESKYLDWSRLSYYYNLLIITL
jgi:hypothetical protein